MAALDAYPEVDALSSGLPLGSSTTELAGFASSALGCPVVLSARFEAKDSDGDIAEACYITPAGGR
jgi:hypothetical protein